MDSSYTTSGRESRNTYSFIATTEDNNARYRCESQNELSNSPLSAEIILSVHCKELALKLFLSKVKFAAIYILNYLSSVTPCHSDILKTEIQPTKNDLELISSKG